MQRSLLYSFSSVNRQSSSNSLSGTGMHGRDHSSRTNARLAVIGAGIVGLTSAIRLKEAVPAAQLTVLADKFDEETTTAGAAGLWEPYKLSDTPMELIRLWGAETFRYLTEIMAGQEAALAGVFETTAYQLWLERREDPEWADIVPHFRRLSRTELAVHNRAAGGLLKDGWAFTTLICEGATHLQWLRKRAMDRGVRFRRCKVHSPEELAEYDLVVNCTGLGAARLFKDATLYPIRGHVIRVRAPWIKQVYFLGEQTYVIPNSDTVVLGGTGDVGEWDTAADARTHDAILQRCRAMLPSLEQASHFESFFERTECICGVDIALCALALAEVVRDWVGLRPGRPSVRLETEILDLGVGRRRLTVVHNYGHGGAGLTLAWGCAGHAVRLALAALGEQQQSRL